MLDNINFVRSTIESGLFYLRTLREFALSIRLSFFLNNEDYIKRAEDFVKKYEELGNVVVNYGKISKAAYDNQIFFTDYTLDCELLTEKLFDVDLNTELTEKEQKISIGELIEPPEEVVKTLKKLNNDALILTTDFVAFLREIYNKIDTNNLFSYLYQSVFEAMEEEANLYIEILNRLLIGETSDPVFVTNYVYRYQVLMNKISEFLRNFSDPSDEEIFNGFQIFSDTFKNLSNDYSKSIITPESQHLMNQQTIMAVDGFILFLRQTIQKVLNSSIHFIVEPVFLDNVLTEANYFRYLLGLYTE